MTYNHGWYLRTDNSLGYRKEVKGTYWVGMLEHEWDGGEYVLDDQGNLVRSSTTITTPEEEH